jgi:hypothetical protein
MRASRQTGRAARETIERAFDAWQRGDLETFRRLIAPDPDSMMYDTGVHEKRFAWKQIRKHLERDWARSDAARMQIDLLNVSAAGPSACAAIDGEMESQIGKQTRSMPIRMTATLENRAGTWVFVQMHFSTPVQAAEYQPFTK